MAKSNILSRLAEALRGARADVDALRDRRLVLIEKIETVRNAPVTEAEIAERVDALLDSAERAALGWANISGLANPDGGLADIDAAFRKEPLGVLAMFNREGTRARLIREAVTHASGKPIDRAVREAEFAKLAGELEDVERAEELAIREAEEAGAVIHRRHDANPALYLAESL